MQRYSKICKGMQSKVYKDMQRYSKVYKDMQRYSKVCKGMQRYSKVGSCTYIVYDKLVDTCCI